MAQFVKHFVQDLTQDIRIRQCGTLVFNADALSNVITIDLYNGTEPATLSGTVVGAVICSDGSTVPIDNGTISGNTVTITLTAACFAILGQIGVGVQIVSGSTKTTVLKAVYNVEAFETDTVVDPDERITISVGDLVQDIADAVATIPADYSDLLATIAPTFSTGTAYAAGQYVWYDGTLYRFTTAHSAGNWNSAQVTAAVVGNDLSDLKTAFNEAQCAASKNKLITSTVTVSGNVGATRNVSGDIYLENGTEYRVQLYNATLTPADFANITSSKITIRDSTDTTDQLTIVSYSALNKTGTTFTWSSTTGWYKFHVIVASANDISSDVLSGGFFVYYNSYYPAIFEAGTYAAKDSDKLDGYDYSDITSAISTATIAVSSKISNGYYVAIGDSITAGSGASAYSKNYYWKLSSALINAGVVSSRMNLGVAGGGSQAVASNCGAYGVYLANAVTIPATTDSVEITLNRGVENSGNQIIEANRNNPCYLSGIAGALSYSSSKYYFTRAEAGTQKYVASGTSLLLFGGKIAGQGDIITIFAGTNDILDTNPSDAKNTATIDTIETMVNLSKTGKYIVVSPYMSSVNNNFRNALSAKFGQRYFDMYSYMSGQGVYDAIAEGLIVSGSQSDWETLLLSDGLHPNDVGHQLIAERLYERMQSLGWV